MAALYTDQHIERLRRGVLSIVGDWGLSPATVVTLLNVSENATFRADDPSAAAPIVIRVHRPGYHSRAEIESELAWIDALRADGVAPIAAPLPRGEGGRIASLETADGRRDVVAFAFMSGVEPSPSDDLRDGFRRLGAISARLHQHSKRWRPPPGFSRKAWGVAATVGPSAYWGDWRDALGLTADGRRVLERAVALMGERLAAFGDGRERFGLIHADLRLANLLIDGERIGVIDFDDCGFGWFLFDFAAAISFFETDPPIPALQDAWLAGYRAVGALSDDEAAELPTFVALRRLQLTAWVASHSETPTAAALGAAYTDGTVGIAERYLREMG